MKLENLSEDRRIFYSEHTVRREEANSPFFFRNFAKRHETECEDQAGVEMVACASEMVAWASEMVACACEMVSCASEMVACASEMVACASEMVACESEMVACASEMVLVLVK